MDQLVIKYLRRRLPFESELDFVSYMVYNPSTFVPTEFFHITINDLSVLIFKSEYGSINRETYNDFCFKSDKITTIRSLNLTRAYEVFELDGQFQQELFTWFPFTDISILTILVKNHIRRILHETYVRSLSPKIQW
jgi:hypothetical protein